MFSVGGRRRPHPLPPMSRKNAQPAVARNTGSRRPLLSSTSSGATAVEKPRAGAAARAPARRDVYDMVADMNDEDFAGWLAHIARLRHWMRQR